MNLGRIRWLFRAWRYRYRLERREITLLLQQLRPGDWAVDVGAHKGAYTYWMQRAAGATGQVFALEPQPLLADAGLGLDLTLRIRGERWFRRRLAAGLARTAGFTCGNSARATSAFFQRVMHARRHTAG